MVSKSTKNESVATQARVGGILVASICAVLGVTATASPQPDAKKTPRGEPQFTKTNKMILPKDYRQWVFVGSALGLGYNRGGSGKGNFSHVYINPVGYNAYKDTGKFPIGTVLMLEILSRGEKTKPALRGSFAKHLIGLEAAVKSGKRFDDPWTYFDFPVKNGRPKTVGSRFTTKTCINCHRKHAADDHVFTQFYPVLQGLRK